MAKYKVEIDEGECISCSACSSAYENEFGVKDDDQKAIVKNPDTDDISNYKAAASECPTGCIHLYEIEGGAKKAITGLVGIVLSSATLLGAASYAATEREPANYKGSIENRLLPQRNAYLSQPSSNKAHYAKHQLIDYC